MTRKVRHALEAREQRVVLRHRFVEPALEHAGDHGRKRQAKSQDRHCEMLEDIEEHIEPEPQEALGEVERRRHARGHARIDPARQRQNRRRHPEGEN